MIFAKPSCNCTRRPTSVLTKTSALAVIVNGRCAHLPPKLSRLCWPHLSGRARNQPAIVHAVVGCNFARQNLVTSITSALCVTSAYPDRCACMALSPRPDCRSTQRCRYLCECKILVTKLQNICLRDVKLKRYQPHIMCCSDLANKGCARPAAAPPCGCTIKFWRRRTVLYFARSVRPSSRGDSSPAVKFVNAGDAFAIRTRINEGVGSDRAAVRNN